MLPLYLLACWRFWPICRARSLKFIQYRLDKKFLFSKHYVKNRVKNVENIVEYVENRKPVLTERLLLKNRYFFFKTQNFLVKVLVNLTKNENTGHKWKKIKTKNINDKKWSKLNIFSYFFWFCTCIFCQNFHPFFDYKNDVGF